MAFPLQRNENCLVWHVPKAYWRSKKRSNIYGDSGIGSAKKPAAGLKKYFCLYLYTVVLSLSLVHPRSHHLSSFFFIARTLQVFPKLLLSDPDRWTRAAKIQIGDIISVWMSFGKSQLLLLVIFCCFPEFLSSPCVKNGCFIFYFSKKKSVKSGMQPSS